MNLTSVGNGEKSPSGINRAHVNAVCFFRLSADRSRFVASSLNDDLEDGCLLLLISPRKLVKMDTFPSVQGTQTHVPHRTQVLTP